MVRLSQASSKGILGTSEYFVQEQKVLGFSLQHESFLPHKFPSFVPQRGILWALWVLEDLQTDNSVETPLKNITLLEQPQGWDQGFEKGPFSRFPSALHPEQSLPDNTEVSFFLWIKLPLQEKYANAIHGSLVWGYSHPAIFSCLAHPADHPLPDMETSLLIQHPSRFWQSAPWACHCLEKGLV